MKHTLTISIIIILLTGCMAARIQPPAEDIGIYTAMELVRIVTALTALDYNANTSGLKRLSAQYDVDMVTPTEEFFAASRGMIDALKQLRHAMFGGRTIEDGDLTDQDLKRLQEQIDLLILLDDFRRNKEIKHVAQSKLL